MICSVGQKLLKEEGRKQVVVILCSIFIAPSATEPENLSATIMNIDYSSN